MNKVFTKYLLFFQLILLAGFTNLYVNANKTNFEHSSYLKTNLSTNTTNGSVKNSQDLFLKSFYPIVEKENDKIRATDNEVAEEEESISTKKVVKTSSFFSTVLYAEQIGYFCANINKRLLQRNAFICFPSNKLHIIFNVFRI